MGSRDPDFQSKVSKKKREKMMDWMSQAWSRETQKLQICFDIFTAVLVKK